MNASGMFKRSMNGIVSPVKWQLALLYLDDIVILFRPLRNHINHIKRVLSLLQNGGVTIEQKSETSSQKPLTILAASFVRDVQRKQSIKHLSSKNRTTKKFYWTLLLSSTVGLLSYCSAQFCTNAGSAQQIIEKRPAKAFWLLDSRGAVCDTRASNEVVFSTDTYVNKR